MKKYILLAFVFFVFEGVKAQVQTLKKPLSKKTIQALPETFVVLDTATYNQLFQKLKYKTDLQDEVIESQKIIIETHKEEMNKVIKINEINMQLMELQKKQIELMQQEIESLKKQLAEKNKKK